MSVTEKLKRNEEAKTKLALAEKQREERRAKRQAERSAARTPVTTNAAGLPAGAAARTRPAYEALDKDGKGLGIRLARRMRIQAAALRQNTSFEKVAKAWNTDERDIELVRALQERALNESLLSSGAAIVFDEVSAELIELLRPSVALMKSGIRVIPMKSQTLTIPRQSAAETGSWVGESQVVSDSAPAFDQIQLQLKKFMAVVPISNDLLRDASFEADILVRDSLRESAVRALDLKGIRGIGSSASPKGLLYFAPSGQKFASAAGSSTPTLAHALSDITKARAYIDTANVMQGPRAWIMSSRVKWGLLRLTDSTGRLFFESLQDANPTLLGSPVFETNAIPNNLSGGGSGGSAESEMYCYEPSQIVCGMGADTEIEVTRGGAYSSSGTVVAGISRDETVVSLALRADFVPRHAEAVSVVQAVTYGA